MANGLPGGSTSSKVCTFVFSDTPSGSPRSGLPLVHFLSTLGLLLLVFLTVWFDRYTRIAKRIQDPARRSSDDCV
jgi:hypothetical protein